MKKFKVELIALCTVAVECETEEEAYDLAVGEVSRGDFEINEGETKEITDQAYWASVVRHASALVALEKKG